MCDVDRKIGIAYGACDSPDAPRAKRIAYVVGPEGKIAQSHSNVDARSYPAEQLKTL